MHFVWTFKCMNDNDDDANDAADADDDDKSSSNWTYKLTWENGGDNIYTGG